MIAQGLRHVGHGWVLLSVVIAAPPAWTQEKRPMTIVDLIEVPSLGDPQLSPDGTQLLYELAEADWEQNQQLGHVWRVNVDGTGTIQLTNGGEGESSPRWSPDGTQIAFLAERGGGEERQLWLIRNRGGEAWQLTQHATAVSGPTWAPDGSALYFLAPDPKNEEEKEREDNQADVYAFDENYEQVHLWKIWVADGREERLTSGDFSVIGYQLSRDGRRIAFHRAPNPLYGYADRSEVWVMDASGGDTVQLTDNTVVERGAALSHDNARVLFRSDSNAEFETYYNDNIFVVPAGGGEARLLAPDFPYEVEEAVWSDDGRSIFFTANMGVHSELFELDLATGTPEQLTEGRHSLGGWAYQPAADAHVFSVNEPTNPGDVYLLAGDGPPERITHVYDYLARQFRLPRTQKIEWEGEDGVMVEGLLYYPLDYEEGTRYPLVVQTHGGPASSDQFGFGRWYSYTQVLTARGWAVLKPNYRGSTGYGDPFLRDMVGHYYRNAHLDVMTAVDHVIELGIADGERMVKMGWSGGGHMTNWIITYTDRFKAASSGAGAVNWISMYAQSDVRMYRTPWFGGTPWEEDAPIEAYWDHSPLKYISNVTTPTIILVGENDVRVPPPQSVELYRALKSNGVPTHLYIAPREPHVYRELRHRLFKINVELDWFERWALGREYEWEEAPVPAAEEQEEVAAR